MSYEYKVVQTPPNIIAQKEADQSQAAAAYLEKLVNDLAEEGWEFYRIDNMGVMAPAGCLNAGSKGIPTTYNLVTFRRKKGN